MQRLLIGVTSCLLTLLPLHGSDANTPGQEAADWLGTTPIDLERPPTYENGRDALDALGIGSRTGVNEDLRRLGLEPTLPSMDPARLEDNELQLSVEQAVFMGLENNRGLRIQQLNPVIARTFEGIERAVFDPILCADAEFNQEAVQPTDFATQRQFSVRRNSSALGAGVLERLPTGTGVELSLSQVKSDSDRTPRQYGTRAGLSVTQALLRGADIEANMALIRQAEVDTLLSVYELHGFTETLVAGIETTYWDYVLAQRQIEIVQTAREVARQQLKETRHRIGVGQLPETEEAAARAEVALRQQDLIDARSQLEKTRIKLLQLINPDIRSGWDAGIRTTPVSEIAEVPLDTVEDRLALAVRMRPELNQARLQIERGRLEVVRTKNGLLPLLDVFLTLGKSSFASSFNQSFSDFEGPSFDVGAGLRFEFPVGNRAARARYQGALATRDQSLESLGNLAQLVSLDVRTAYIEAQRTFEQITASRATRALQEEVLRTEQARFRVGNSTSFDVALAQRDHIQSRMGEIEAIVAYRKALIELYRLEGSLLERRGIGLPGGDMVNVSTR